MCVGRRRDGGREGGKHDARLVCKSMNVCFTHQDPTYKEKV